MTDTSRPLITVQDYARLPVGTVIAEYDSQTKAPTSWSATRGPDGNWHSTPEQIIWSDKSLAEAASNHETRVTFCPDQDEETPKMEPKRRKPSIPYYTLTSSGRRRRPDMTIKGRWTPDQESFMRYARLAGLSNREIQDLTGLSADQVGKKFQDLTARGMIA